MPISILFLTTGLGVGGAEMMLYKLLSRIDRSRFTPQVVSLIDCGPLSERIQTLNVPIRSLGMSPGKLSPLSLLRLISWLRQDRPDLLQTWMYHADLLGAVAAKLARSLPVVWCIQQGDLSPENNKRLTLRTARACALVSRGLATRIVCCSEASRRTHIAAGYAAEKMVVIPNAADITTFGPDSAARDSVRKELEISSNALIIGLVGRFHPQKDHGNFIRAAALLHRVKPDVHFLLCGSDVTWDNSQLAQWIREAGIMDRCHLLGRRDDTPRLTAAFDIATSSSGHGEGFPMVLGEAMGCGVPCVVTDVGDSALIVGDTGRVVPPRDPSALASAWVELIDIGAEGREKLGIAARRRVKEQFNLPVIVERYEELYEQLVADASA